jgi:tetratricopeptide (TPR) repeat protein
MFKKAEDILRQGIGLAEKNNLPLLDLVYMLEPVNLYLAAGDLAAAEKALSEIWQKTEEQGRNPSGSGSLLYWKTIVLARKKMFEEARAACAVFASLFENSQNKHSMRSHLLLQGIIELERGNNDKAVEFLTQSKAMVPFEGWSYYEDRGEFIPPLALAYLRLGDLERARQEYEEVTRLTYGRLFSSYSYAKSFYMLGQIYEQLGKKNEARANYRKFLDLWKKADPGRPEVEDAKKHLTALK